MTLTAAKRALSSSDPILFGRAYNQLRAQGVSDAALYRLAVSADASITADVWADRVVRASELR